MKKANNKSMDRPRDAEGRFESESQASKQGKQGNHMGGQSRQRDADGRFESEGKSKK